MGETERKNEQQLQEIKEKLEEMTDCIKIESLNCIQASFHFGYIVQLKARVKRMNVSRLYINFLAYRDAEALNEVLERVSQSLKRKIKEMSEK